MQLVFQLHELARYQLSHSTCACKPKPVAKIRHSVINPREIWQEMSMFIICF